MKAKKNTSQKTLLKRMNLLFNFMKKEAKDELLTINLEESEKVKREARTNLELDLIEKDLAKVLAIIQEKDKKIEKNGKKLDKLKPKVKKNYTAPNLNR